MEKYFAIVTFGCARPRRVFASREAATAGRWAWARGDASGRRWSSSRIYAYGTRKDALKADISDVPGKRGCLEVNE